uniref:Transposon Ty3-G Gag-Pol polyprotein n=1 Tax=Cajanus cajan TaxID=3821 RepID=A0A151RAU0_CAJCA|nr:Transposon Ty3-G Gag-Pol polyprotein [Cajanus cajan]
MPGIDPNFLFHMLSIRKEAKSIAQRRRKAGEERKAAIEGEVCKLLDARFIREVHYTTWLANVVMVKKPNGKWRMCTDYTNLNKACPKDAYPLPNIDRLVDGASGHKFLSFLDAYSRYNQIRMHPRDEKKTTFITETTNYWYRVMLFGLKNVGATYQHLMNKIFNDQIGRSMEVYVDDMVVKSSDVSTHVRDLAEVFQALRQHQMRLNPEKCVFGVSGGKFLGFMLSNRGIEANPDKCQAILDMKSPGTLKEVQKLADMIIYLAVSSNSISVVVVQEHQGNQQPIYFISWTLQDTERRSAKGAWAEDLPEVLWAYRCTPQSTTKETPFRLAYGADAMILVEVGEPSFRRQHFHEESNDSSLRAELDVLDEVREKTQVVPEACKQRMSRHFNSNLKPRTFHEGDLVWREIGSARRNSSEGKLSANWDGPFRVRHALHNGAYKLEELSGKVIPRTWNATHLKTYYS